MFATSGIIGIDTIAQSSVNGVQTVFWVVFSCVFFAIPYAFIAADMGSTYVKNGGLYVWIKEAYNPYVASLLTFMYWISNPIWMASLAVEAVSVMEGLSGAKWSTTTEWVIALLLIWLVALMEITYLNVGKWLPNIGAVIKVVLLLSVGALAIGMVASSGHAANSFAFSQFLPTKAVAVSYLPVLMYQWQGFAPLQCLRFSLASSFPLRFQRYCTCSQRQGAADRLWCRSSRRPITLSDSPVGG